MTSTLDRPVSPRAATRRAPVERSPLGPGLLAAAWALGAGLVTLGIPVLLAWATDSRSGSGAADATRAVGQLWLFAHGASMTVPGGPVGLTPLALMLLPLALLHRAGRHGARSLEVVAVAQAVRLVVAVAFPYALVAAVVSALSATAAVQPAPVQAVIGALVVALLGSASGVLRQSGLYDGVDRLPEPVRRVVAGATASVCVLLAAGGLLGAAALGLHVSRASALAGASDPGLLGGLALLGISLAYLPNAVIWGAAWLLGPGFAVGVGTAVNPFSTVLGPAPAVPLLAALPGGPPPGWAALALGVPLLAGAVGGLLLGRRHDGSATAAAAEGVVLGFLGGGVLAALCVLSAGSLGSGRLAHVGPVWWQVGLASAGLIGLGAAATAALVRRPGPWRD